MPPEVIRVVKPGILEGSFLFIYNKFVDVAPVGGGIDHGGEAVFKHEVALPPDSGGAVDFYKVIFPAGKVADDNKVRRWGQPP